MSEVNQRSSTSARTDGLVVTQELIEEFLSYLQEKKGRVPETVATYRSYMKRVYSFLPDGKEIVPGTLEELWQRMENEGFATSTVNVSISAVNSLLEYCNRRDLQLPLKTREKPLEQPEMTRTEYQKLLQAARRQGKEQTYLLIKLFACTGINIHELDQVTVEAVNAGSITVWPDRNKATQLHLPRCLCEEIKAYMNRKNITSGPIFLNKYGKTINRATISRMVAELADEAQVPRDKCNPRCLQRLYQTTQETIENNIFLQVQQMHELLIDQEQVMVGWDK